MTSFQSLLNTCCGANERSPEDGKDFKILSIVQQLLKVSPPLPYPRKGFAERPFSSEAGVGGRGVG